MPKPFAVKHCQMDLDKLIERLQERLQRNIDAIKSLDREPTPVEEARFEVGWGLLRDLLIDLNGMKDSWADGRGAYRVTEKDLSHED